VSSTHVHRIGGEPAHLDDLSRITLGSIERPSSEFLDVQVTYIETLYGELKYLFRLFVFEGSKVHRVSGIPE